MLAWKHVLVLAVATVSAVILCLFLVRYSADTRPDDGNEVMIMMMEMIVMMIMMVTRSWRRMSCTSTVTCWTQPR